MELHLTGMKEGYALLLSEIFRRGEVAYPRGLETLEVLEMQLILRRPEMCLPTGTRRNLNKAIALVEATSLIAGEAYPHTLNRVSNGNFDPFFDGEVMHGAYGPRVRGQIPTALRKLQSDEHSRQAVVTVWDPLYDNQERADTPCTVALQYFLRDDKLYATTYMRSNDAWRGVPYDVFQFTQLQWTMANFLQVDAGPYRHVVGSMHLYSTDYELAEDVTTATSGDTDEWYGARPFYDYGLNVGQSWNTFRESARSVLTGTSRGGPGCRLLRETAEAVHGS